jgi:hypothetical protein
MNQQTDTTCSRAVRTALRRALATVIMASYSVAALADDTDEQKARVAEARKMAKEEAEAYTMFLAADPEKELKLKAQPIQYWTNPVDGAIHGSVFIWTRDGRPEVLASMYQYYSPEQVYCAEMQSLSEQELSASKGGDVVWRPPAGVKFQAVPDSTEPASTPAGRLRQMQSLARCFTADLTDYKNVTRPLRVLARPLYRYNETPSDLLDGAMFALGSGTDPEIILLIEARRTETGFQWQYAPARLSVMRLQVKYEKRLVWNVDKAAYPYAQPREPYTIFERALTK